MIYLASPYSHDNEDIRKMRYYDACHATAALMEQGKFVFSPIVNSHPLVRFGLPGGWDYWQHFDVTMISKCDELVVLKLDGWKKSRGINNELKIAKFLGKPITKLFLKEILDVNRCSTAIPIR